MDSVELCCTALETELAVGTACMTSGFGVLVEDVESFWGTLLASSNVCGKDVSCTIFCGSGGW